MPFEIFAIRSGMLGSRSKVSARLKGTSD